LAANKPDVVFHCAATVGGILANDTRPAEFIYDNLAIETTVIDAAWRAGVEKLLFLGSACIYPKDAPQPMAEDALLTGPLEPTNEWYAIAKIAGIKLIQSYRKQYGADFISAQPINLYGPNDNFDPDESHVIPGLIGKAHRAREQGASHLTLWGSGRPLREFLHVDDLADALVFLMQSYSGPLQVNIGTGEEVSIRQLAESICAIIGFDGDLKFDGVRPDGVRRKLLNVEFLRSLGWTASIPLDQGLRETYAWYRASLG
jgi:GDP-L-fucose synthase